jgi:hypothetical protein
MPNPLDGSDLQFDAAVTAFAAWLVTHFAEVGLTAPENTAIQTALTTWATKYAANGPAQTAATLAQFEKDSARGALAGLVRDPAKKVTDQADRVAAGLNEYEERRGRVPVPTTRPILMVDTSQRLQHTIKFVDETSPHTPRKPDGVASIELWCCVAATPPAGPDDCEYLGNDTKPPYLAVHEASEANKTCHYIGRWVNTRGEKGPWSETVSATVTG